MYIGAASFAPLFMLTPPLSSSDSEVVVGLHVNSASAWLENAFAESWAFILRVFDMFKNWFMCWGPSLVQHHPHPFHILGWAIFFGPIIVLVPCLVVVEIATIVLFHLGVVFHGQSQETIPDRFAFLKDYFIESRESLFATVEHWTAVFNKWTVAHPALLVLRLLGGAMGLFVLVGIWNGW
ncbi:hypothetical protein CVT25_014885 [Psilocybe cyanescens]|uniref:Uncharacterized protein n=1 Tax=Psilocybe cyanescens TaxID=93625 RepID=A0A409WEX6_PSICY|nr:hypothetical protein CVT25_014885 [Psilocybe cyanescens]